MTIGIDARFWKETGVGRYIKNLVIFLDKSDTSHSFVLFIRPEDQAEIESQVDGERFSFVPTSIRWHSLGEQLNFGKVIKKEGLDLMHFTYFSVPIFYSDPFILTIHDLILHHFPTGQASTLPLPLYYLKWLSYKQIIQSGARRARHIIAVSQATKAEIVDHLSVPGDKVSVIYEGVDSAMQARSPQPAAHNESSYFLHVGNVYPHKDPRVLVDAFSKREDRKTSLYFVGKKDHFMNDLEAYVKRSKIEGVVFKGFVPDKELAMYYQNALATVVCSKMEGFGLPALEAMANLCPVIASDIPSLREVTAGQAHFFQQGNMDELTDLLNTLAKTDKNKYASRKNEALKIAHSYSWERMAKETIKRYERCNRL